MQGPYGIPGTATLLPPFLPGGRLTLVPGTPVMVSDQSAKTVVYYTPDTHNAFPIIRNGNRQAVYFDEPRLVLSTAHLASTIYDVFGIERDGKGHLVTGAWATSTAGAGDRGASGGTVELARVGGMLVNRWGMVGRNDDGGMFIPPMEGVYLGSLFIDAAAGQVTCHVSYGQSRKWGVWNAYNRKPLYLKAGDATASWTYNTAVIRPSNNAAANSLTVFQGLAEEFYELQFAQRIFVDEGVNPVVGNVGIGWNSTTAMSGRIGVVGVEVNGNTGEGYGNGIAEYLQVPTLGINVATSLENAVDTGDNITWYGTEANMVLSAKWRG